MCRWLAWHGIWADVPPRLATPGMNFLNFPDHTALDQRNRGSIVGVGMDLGAHLRDHFFLLGQQSHLPRLEYIVR